MRACGPVGRTGVAVGADDGPVGVVAWVVNVTYPERGAVVSSWRASACPR